MREEAEGVDVEHRDVEEAAHREGGEDGDVGEVPGRVPSQVEGGEDDGGAGHSDQVEAKHRQLAVKSPHIAGAKTGLSPRPPVVSLQVPGLGQEEEEDGHDDRAGLPLLPLLGQCYLRAISSRRTLHLRFPTSSS